MKLPAIAPALYALISLMLVAIPVFSYATEPDNEKADQELRSVFYLTLRNITGDPDPEDRFGDERDSLRAGQCTFSLASLRLLKPLSENGLVFIPEHLNQLESVSEVDDSAFWSELHRQARGLRPLLYLHGYNTSFAKACDQAALFQANLNLDRRLVLFSWPSDGAFLNYARDEADLVWSVAPLERIMLRMVEEFGAGGFDVVAHSLGARGMLFALVQLANRHYDVIPLLNQLVLTAPDIDAGIFQQYLEDILPLAANISLYVSANDRPLALSREVHGYPRLGQSGPHLKDMEGIEIIDVTDVGVRSFSGHLYHLYHDNVAQDLDLLLNQGIYADQRETLAASKEGGWRIKQEDEAQ